MSSKTDLRHKVLLITFASILSLVIIEVLFEASGALYVNLIERRNRISLTKAGVFRILFLGESTTAEGGWDSYPREVGRILNQRLPEKGVSIINKGVPAVNTSFILSELEDNLKEYNPHMVVVMMGVNDTDEDEGAPRLNPVRRLLA
jgi:hypothetical protein